MPYRDLEPLSKQLTIVVGLTAVGFMAFGLALSSYRNILFDTHLEDIAQSNADLEDDITTSQEDLDYYQSAQYKDKYAKETLGRLSPGEKVLMISDAPKLPIIAPDGTVTVSEQQLALYEDTLRLMPVYEHWKLFLFEREKMEELKRGL